MSLKQSANKFIIFITSLILLLSVNVFSQDIERERPKEWKNLVRGGAFIDRFESIPIIGELKSDVWGWKAVLPRYVDNGIEDQNWSYWGGNIIVGSDSLYHLFVCRWPEKNEKGHMFWSKSEVVRAVSNNRFGPYKVEGEAIGKGHNPEVFQLKDGRYVISVIDAYYISDSLYGPWEKARFEFDPLTEVNVESLRFGASEEINFGRGCKALSSSSDGNDLIVIFDGNGNGLTDADFAGKLLGNTNQGKLIIGYSKLPGVEYLDPFLSAREPVFTIDENQIRVKFEVQNFGQVASSGADWEVLLQVGSKTIVLEGKIGSLQPCEKKHIENKFSNKIVRRRQIPVRITLKNNVQKLSLYEGKIDLD